MINIIQACVIMFIAAPTIIRWIYRIKAAKGETGLVLTKGWGK
jgi:hypothetical protein